MLGTRKWLVVVAGCLAGVPLAVSDIPVSAADSVVNPPSTYVNANFGSAHPPFNFYRSRTTLDFDSATADVDAARKGSKVELSISAAHDPNETSTAYSAYNVGVVNAGSHSLTSVTVVPQSLTLSGNAHWAMNLWFDADHNGEYFTWQKNNPDYLTGLGGDQFAIGPCESNDGTCPAPGNGTITIGPDTPLFVMPGCPGNATTLAIINSGGCATIPPNTHVAMWVGIDIAGAQSGSGSATIRTADEGDHRGGGDQGGGPGKDSGTATDASPQVPATAGPSGAPVQSPVGSALAAPGRLTSTLRF
jgi:hypothetical protein